TRQRRRRVARGLRHEAVAEPGGHAGALRPRVARSRRGGGREAHRGTGELAANRQGAMIRFDNVSKTFGQGATQVQVLRNLTLTIPEGQFCAIRGPSGSGKSTILHVTAGLTPLTAGEAWVDEYRLSGMSDRDAALFRRRSVGIIFQFFHLLPYLTAEEN